MASGGAQSLFCHCLVILAGALALSSESMWKDGPGSHFEAMQINCDVVLFLPASG